MTNTNSTTCPFCKTEVHRSSTPTIFEDGHKEFGRHIDTGLTFCAERIAAESK